MASFPTTGIGFAETGLHKTNNLGSSVASGGPYSDSATTISVADAGAATTWPTANFVCLVEDTGELFFVTSRSGNTLTVATRGFGGTTADGISDGDTISVVLSSNAIQAVMDELVAIEDVLLGGTQADLTVDGSLTLDDTTGSGDLTVAGAAIFNGSGTFNGTLVLPTAAAPTPTAEGEIWWDSDDDVLRIGDGAATIEIGATTGFVDTSGTPADNQLSIFTDADTIEGDANLTWDGSTLAVIGSATIGGETVPSLTGTPADNQLAIFTDADTIEGDGNLTWDGSKLAVTGAASLDGAVTINESGADVDFRVEGNTEPNLLFVDASTDRVGIGTSSPSGFTDDAALSNTHVEIDSDNVFTTAEKFAWLTLRDPTGGNRGMQFGDGSGTNNWCAPTIIGKGSGDTSGLTLRGIPSVDDSNRDGVTIDVRLGDNSALSSVATLLQLTNAGSKQFTVLPSGAVEIRTPNTTTGTGLVVAGSGLNEIQRDSSTARDKENITTVTIDPRAVLDIQPKHYKRKGQDVSMLGFVVEDFHDAGFTDILGYDPDGQPASFKEFGRGLIALQHYVLQDLDERVKDLERTIRDNGSGTDVAG